jgi:hypothetical protein
MKMIIETKGYEVELDQLKFAALSSWCTSNGYTYKIFHKDDLDLFLSGSPL